MPFCSECGAEVFPDARFCMVCGAKVNLRRRADYPDVHLAEGAGSSRVWEHESESVFIYSEAKRRSDPNAAIRFFEVDVVGESDFPKAFAKILGALVDGEERLLEEVMAVLLREPDNPADPNAVAVHLVDTGMTYHKAGRLSADDAKDYAETIRKLEERIDQKVGCLARVYGRGETESAGPVYRAQIYLPDPEEWLKWKW